MANYPDFYPALTTRVFFFESGKILTDFAQSAGLLKSLQDGRKYSLWVLLESAGGKKSFFACSRWGVLLVSSPAPTPENSEGYKVTLYTQKLSHQTANSQSDFICCPLP
jgi:hypothetical protein